MGKHGQFNYKGINFQSWAAMSLFLQYLRNPDFLRIELEAQNFEDFNLVFKDGHKIICESKCHNRNFSCASLKSIIHSLTGKVKEDDEILIICTKLSSSLEDKVKHIKYFYEKIAPYFRKKGFRHSEIQLLSKVRFWTVVEKAHYLVVYSLFSELLNFWIPQDELERKTDSILLSKIYGGLANGHSFTREDIFLEIDGYRKNAIKYSGYFDIERNTTERQIENILKAIDDNKSPTWAPGQLSAISAKPNLIFYILDKFKSKKIQTLRDWKDLWQLNKVFGFSFNMYAIFENNLHNDENRKYTLEFIEKSIPEIHNFYRHNFFEMDVVRLINKVLDKDEKLINPAFEIVKEMLKNDEDDYFYLKTRESERIFDKEEVCKVLNRVYSTGPESLKAKIYKLIINNFNLVEDEGEYSHYTPKQIFDILNKYLILDSDKIETKFIDFTHELSQQYDKFYKKFGKKVTYNGWELMGGATCFWGHDYKIDDRHFVDFILGPVLYKYYTENKEKAWDFIKKQCITSDSKVDKEHPDFLNRSAIGVILERYRQEDANISNEAFGILKDFVLRRKGIPHKAELIYQALRKDFTDEKKWKLLSVIIERYKIPANPFVELIVSDLANRGHKQAKETFNEWAKNSDYYKKASFFDRNITQHIDKILDTSFDDAIKLFEDFINNEYFIQTLDTFDAYKVAHVLGKILSINLNVGIGILNKLDQQTQNLSKNQQILFTFGILDLIDKKGEDEKLIVEIYSRIIDPLFNKFDNRIDLIVQKFPHGNAREAFAQLAEKLAKAKMIKEALRIIKIFANDPEPYLPGSDPEDLDAKYSYHKKIEDSGECSSSISSVRGWCAWSLAHCIVLEGRDYLYEIIELIKKLSSDKDYYVLHMTCFSLSRLVCYRLSHMPEDKNKLFFNDDKKTALTMAKEVEKIAMSLLDKILTSTSNVQKALVKSAMSVIECIKTLSEKDALQLILKLEKFPPEESSEMTSLFLYYAEFRKDSFKDWRWHLPGLYDNVLQPFDDTEIKAKVKEIMLNKPETRAAFAWEFYRTTDSALRKIKNSMDYEGAFLLSIKYIDELISEYDHRTFEIIYRFIDENIKQPSKFDSCYDLWIKCIGKEKPALEEMIKAGKIYDISWWPYHYNGNLLLLVLEKKGEQQFLNDLEFLSNYPKEVNAGNIKDAVDIMKKMKYPNDQIEKIFNNLIERNLSFYDDKQQWINQKSDK